MFSRELKATIRSLRKFDSYFQENLEAYWRGDREVLAQLRENRDKAHRLLDAFLYRNIQTLGEPEPEKPEQPPSGNLLDELLE